MIVVIPLIVLLLIASIVLLGAMLITHNYSNFSLLNPGNLVILMASSSAILALGALLFAFFSGDKESGSDDNEFTPKDS